MGEWRINRHNLGMNLDFTQKLRRAWHIVDQNKLNFLLLLLWYFVTETIGNAALLVVQWTLDKNTPRTSYLILVQLTANWPVRLWRALLNMCVLNVVLRGLKREDTQISLGDIAGVKSVISVKIVFSMFIADIVLASPMAIAQALISSDLLWSFVYLVFGFLLNWLFGMAPFLVFEDHKLGIWTCLGWSAAAALSPAAFSTVLASCLFVFFATPFVVTAPLVLVMQVLTFFQVFGFGTKVVTAVEGSASGEVEGELV